MSSNQDKIFNRYTVGKEDGRETYSRNDGLEYHYTKKHLEGFIGSTDDVLEIGCATGYYGFYYADKCRTYVGVDLFPPHIELLNHRISEILLRFIASPTCADILVILRSDMR